MEVRRVRRLWAKQEKRQIVEQTFKPGASVSVVARAHEVNANQVFQWRKQYREGRLGVEQRLLPVKIADAAVDRIQPKTRQRSAIKRNGVIDIDLGHARVRIEGAADPDCIRAALEGLLQ
jgi:transposase